MKASLRKLLLPLLTLCPLLAGISPGSAQILVRVDPSAPWVGYMNRFDLSANYLEGGQWGTADLRANFQGTDKLVLQPCTNVWETIDTYWVQQDGVTPNKILEANFYVQDDNMANTNVIFIGQCLSNNLTQNPEPLTGVPYTSVAFIKAFDAGYSTINSVKSNLVAGQAFSISLDTTGAAHVQYGFATMGPDANPATAAALGQVTVGVAGASALVTVDPTQTWIGYMKATDLPANGGATKLTSPWGPSDLQAAFTGTSLLTLAPCTNVWETTDTFWVQADKTTPNAIMDASFYVQNDNLANTNLVFIGTCLDNLLTAFPEPQTGIYYSSKAFIKTFDGSWNLLGSVSSAELAAGQAFGISLNTAGAVHVQYGFETVGPDASPSAAPGLGTVVLAAAVPPSPLAVPTTSAPVPTRAASSVLCLYNSSGTYVVHPVERWLASWSGAAETSYTIAGTGRSVLKYTGLQYAGVEFYSNDPVLGANGDNVGGATDYSINATAYDTFHVDVFTPNANQFGVQLVSINPTQAAQVDLLPSSGAITTGSWLSLDIPLASFKAVNPNVDWTTLQQLLWLDNESGGGFTGGIFYLDNIYFYNSTAVQPPTITASPLSGSIRLSFPTQNGLTYTVQYKASLKDTTWQTLTSVTGNGSVQTVTDPMNQAARFYRLYVH